MTVMTTPRAGEPARSFPYAANFEARAKAPQPAALPVSVIRVAAEADPNILARIVQPMVKLDLMPRGMYVLSDDGGDMVAEFVFAAEDSDQVKRLANILRAVIGVASVQL